MPKEKAEIPAKKSRGKELGGIAFVGFFFLGMALGALYGRWDIAPFAGLAMGFIAMLVVMMKG
jgi:hypothetical protein